MKYLFFLLLFIVINVNAQQINHLDPETFCQPVFISQENGMGTGFFIKDSSRWYLVTAKHVLLELKSNKLLSNKVVLIAHSTGLSNQDKNSITIDLKSAMDSNKVFSNVKDDAIIVEMGKVNYSANESGFSFNLYVSATAKNKSIAIKPMSPDTWEQFKNVHLGEEIYLFGYPTSLGLRPMTQFDYEKPLLRSGIIAGKYEERHTIIIDCAVFPGNSGGPVISKSLDKDNKRRYQLVGIVSQFIPYYDQAIDIANGKKSEDTIYQLNSGYAVIVPIDVVTDLIKSHK